MHQAKEMAYEKKTLEKDITHNLKKKKFKQLNKSGEQHCEERRLWS